MAEEFKPRRGPVLPDLPENWSDYTREEKLTWMTMYYRESYREGEYYGLFDFAPQNVKDAYEELMKEDDYYVHIN